MAKKNSDQGGAGGGSKSAKGASTGYADVLKEAGERAADLARNPVARSMLAAGLVTAAAALTANARVRKTVRDAGRDALDTAEAAADSASKIGAAIVTAATDAVRRLLAASSGDGGATSSARARSGG